MVKKTKDLDKKEIRKVKHLLKELGEEVFDFTFKVGKKVYQFSMLSELMLGDNVENPHYINGALDKQPAMKMFWNALLLRIKEELRSVKLDFEIQRAIAREHVQNELEGKPTKDDIETRLTLRFDKYTNKKIPAKFVTKNSDYYKKLINYKEVKNRKLRLEHDAEILRVLVEAWDSRGYNLKSIAELVGSMMTSQILIVKDIRVVEKGGIRKAKKEFER